MPGHSDNNGKPNSSSRGGFFRQGESKSRQDSFSKPAPRSPQFRRDDRPAQGEGFAPRNKDFRRDDRRPAPQASRPAAKTPEDADWNEPQKAVGGIREVESLLENKPGLVHRVLFQKDSGDKRLYALQKKVKHLHIHHQQLDATLLDQQARNHQGVVALCHEREVARWEQVRSDLFAAKAENRGVTVAVIVNIEDPRNLGACLRSCLALGVDVVLLASKGMCGLTPLAARASAGAMEKLTLCRPDNLEGALGELVAAGFALLGLDADTPDSLHNTPFPAQTIIAVGGEDRDLPPFIRKQCTKVLRIPMQESAHSYNASVALTLALYERARSLGFPGMVS